MNTTPSILGFKPFELYHQTKFCAHLKKLNWAVGRTKHAQTYDGFLRAASLGIDPEFAYEQVVQQIQKARGVLDVQEVRRQQQRALDYVGSPAAVLAPVAQPPATKTTFSPAWLKKVAAKASISDPAATLRACSPVSVEMTTSAEFLDMLYKPGELILTFDDFRSQGQPPYIVASGNNNVLPQDGPEGVWFLVQPVDGFYHFNPRQKTDSRRSEEAVTSWRYLVLESDEADTGEWLRAIVQLPLRIAAIYTSGGRSIHCLVRVDAASKSDWDQFKKSIQPVVVALGADHGALTAVRLSRLPGCWRGDRRQELLYLNPEANGHPIMDRIAEGHDAGGHGHV